MNKFWNWTKDEETSNRVLRLDGMITDDEWLADIFDSKTAKQFREELNTGTGEGDITVWINSEGGSCFAAAQMYNALKDYRGKVRVCIDAVALSAASVVAMAGDTVEISPVGIIMIHNPWTYAEGDSDEMKTTAEMLDEVKESIINAYELKTKLSRKELAKMMDDETWIHAKKAVELGFVDKIIGVENQPVADNLISNISSRRQVWNCMMKAFKAKSKNKSIDAAKLHKRLNQFAH